MREHQLIKIKPISPFHIGELADLEVTEVIIHSDTLFSALCNISGKFFGDESYKSFITPFLNNNPSFLLSSAFPYCETPQHTIYFFPKPLSHIEFLVNTPEAIKTYKKIRFVSTSIFNAFLKNDIDFLYNQLLDSNNEIKTRNLIQNTQVWLSEEEREEILEIDHLWKINQSPRVTIDRITRETSIYNYSRVHYHPNAGLFILINIKDKNNLSNILNDLFKKLRYLGDTGIGGERTLGNGQFELATNKNQTLFSINLEENDEENTKLINLSLLLPTETDIEQGLLKNDAFYQIIKRRGWISNKTYRRKSINMLLEGSIFKAIDQETIGKIQDVTPEILKEIEPNYKIHRYGYSYSLKIKS